MSSDDKSRGLYAKYLLAYADAVEREYPLLAKNLRNAVARASDGRVAEGGRYATEREAES